MDCTAMELVINFKTLVKKDADQAANAAHTISDTWRQPLRVVIPLDCGVKKTMHSTKLTDLSCYRNRFGKPSKQII